MGQRERIGPRLRVNDKELVTADGTGLIKRFYDDVIGKGEVDLIDELTTDDLVDHEEGLPGQPPGREGVRFFAKTIHDAFSDFRVKTMEPTLVDGNLEAARSIVTGTHTGAFLGVAATDKAVEFESIDIIRIDDGKVAEHWGVTDVTSLMQQLGALPE
jgi:steroid delta-isomerase-like uncharacterized protein